MNSKRSLSSAFKGVSASPLSKKIAKNVFAITFCAGTLTGSFILLLDEYNHVLTDRHNSMSCANVQPYLYGALELAVEGGNQEIINNVVESIRAYERGEGERARDEDCQFNQINEELDIYGLN